MRSKFLVFIGTCLLSTAALANYNVVNCDSTQGTDHSLTLIVVNNDVKQVRVLSPGHRTRALVPTRVINQNIEGSTLYTLIGIPGFMEVENKVLEGNRGFVKLSNDEFSCF